jgi:hypothetical protein
MRIDLYWRTKVLLLVMCFDVPYSFVIVLSVLWAMGMWAHRPMGLAPREGGRGGSGGWSWRCGGPLGGAALANHVEERDPFFDR